MSRGRQPPAPGRGTTSRIRDALAHRPPGTVFTTQELLALGMGMSRTALDVALKRLVDEGDVMRAGRGLFYLPVRHPIIGTLPPDAQHLAEAIAHRTGAQLLPVGPDAAHRLGLSTQVPGRAVFYTTGRGGRRKLEERTIELRHRSPRLASAAPIVAIVMEALRSLGKVEAASAKVTRQLTRVLTPEQKESIQAQLHFVPEWMRPILRRVTSS